MSDVVAIIAVKKKSRRLKNKNILLIDKKPLFFHTIKPAINSKLIDNVFVSTNSVTVQAFCESFKINTIWRGPNKSRTNEPLFDVLKYSYSTLNKSYKYLVTILANAPGHTTKEINDAIKLIKKKKLSEVRAFNAKGEETGLLVFEIKEFMKKSQISSYVGMIKSSAIEIHTQKDFNYYKQKLK